MQNAKLRMKNGKAPKRRALRVFPFFIFSFSFLIGGCMGLSTSRNPAPPAAAPLLTETPSAADLVAYLNRRSATVSALATTDVDLDIKADGQSFGVHGDLHCQKPRNFRLRAKVPVTGAVAADFGSNDN